MSLINISNLTFSYDSCYENIFQNASFQMDTNWKLGLIGRNGRGKTTLLKLLLGMYPYSGSISSNVSFEYFPYEIENKERDTLEIIEDMIPDLELWKLKRELSLLELPEEVLYRSFSTLSNGEQTKVLLAALFLKEEAFLLIDEPTNHLDLRGREIVGNYLNSKRGFILVSHDRFFLDQCTDHILSINKADIEIQKGNFSTWQLNKDRMDQFELAENEKLKKEIKNLTEASKRTAKWSDQVESTKNGSLLSGIKPDKGYIGHKAAKMMKRSKTIEARMEKSIEDKSKLLKNLETVESLAIKPVSYHKSKLAEAIDLFVVYDERKIMDPISFSVSAGDRIAIKGQNGSGKSSILKLILGEEIEYRGNYHTGSGLIISYVPQDTSFLQGDLRTFAREESIDESLFKAILRKLDFSRTQFDKDLREFSAGQKKKVLIAKSLCQEAHLYIWDEPLNYIDVISRMQIEELILQYRPTMIFVEHDRCFIRNIATAQITLTK